MIFYEGENISYFLYQIYKNKNLKRFFYDIGDVFDNQIILALPKEKTLEIDININSRIYDVI